MGLKDLLSAESIKGRVSKRMTRRNERRIVKNETKGKDRKVRTPDELTAAIEKRAEKLEKTSSVSLMVASTAVSFVPMGNFVGAGIDKVLTEAPILKKIPFLETIADQGTAFIQDELAEGGSLKGACLKDLIPLLQAGRVIWEWISTNLINKKDS